MEYHKSYWCQKSDKYCIRIFKESTHELGNHYNTFRIEKSKYEGKIQSQPNENENITTDNKINIMIWNARSLNDFTKKIYELANKSTVVNPVTSEEYKQMNPASSDRPKNSQLSKQKLESIGIVPSNWEDALANYLKEELK